ncbi:MAG: outer membrane beta-barrel protein [Bacteroidota bacterium]
MYKYLPIIICFLVSTVSSAQSFTKNESFGVTLSLPFINRYTYFGFETENTQGVLGIGSSVYYKHNKFKYSLNGALTRAFQSFRDNENINVNLIEGLVHYNVYNKFNIIGGLNFSDYKFSSSPDFYDSLTPSKYKKEDRTLGLTIGAEIVCTNHFSIVAFYRPSIYCFDKKSFKQMFSLDFRFDINLWRRK